MRIFMLIANLIMAPLYSTPLLANQETAPASEQDVLQLDWLDLIPEQERKLFDQQGMPMPDHNGTEPAKQQQLGTVRTELNGSRVKIPGFVIPLEGDDQKVTEFLLVPYFGACIHVPPPPPNQIIYVKFPKGAPIQELWDVIYVIGELKTESLSHDLAETAYTIVGTEIAEYDDM
ncbi:lipoprotein [Vibrio mimicus]|uniref:DUF3299 domain-containing protein n=1 Tax=Vibrio mimicus TaxID=674 RepID=UPI0002BA7BFA|nr:DUF3299 domain-containing protein [Vibrio mimicus]EMB51059.1 hypothetical protein D908_04816 [Vibrio mimicus CAIM 602]MBY7675297.1 DUF3299 domain-containing protein [Vibrio mimicus]MBY7727025.1 DUF3299 domain-containing protein [Vibrio mimicus]TXY32783.1 DUF3299 domain-containing protein [Vibrio mimicus]SUP13046.1 lipoprotein [Vibrio mimicus]